MSRIITLVKMCLILIIVTIIITELDQQINYNINLQKTYCTEKMEDMVNISKSTAKQINIIVKANRDVSELIKKVEVVNEEIFVLTFYTDLPEENGPYGNLTCNSERLSDGMVANNILPQGTKITTKEFGELVVADRGGDNFNERNRLDVFIPRNKGEDNDQYKKRVNDLGIVEIKGHVP